MSSLGFLQSNGKAESTAKTARILNVKGKTNRRGHTVLGI